MGPEILKNENHYIGRRTSQKSIFINPLLFSLKKVQKVRKFPSCNFKSDVFNKNKKIDLQLKFKKYTNLDKYHYFPTKTLYFFNQ